MMKIETICKRFLWTRKVESSKKALVAWKQLCWTKTVGGMNITDIIAWNRAAILKHLWNLCKKKDRLWIQWMHTYYIKQGEAWTVKAKQASWLTQKILGAARYLIEANLRVEEVMTADCYSIRDIYNKLRGEFSKVAGRKLLCNNDSCPK